MLCDNVLISFFLIVIYPLSRKFFLLKIVLTRKFILPYLVVISQFISSKCSLSAKSYPPSSLSSNCMLALRPWHTCQVKFRPFPVISFGAKVAFCTQNVNLRHILPLLFV